MAPQHLSVEDYAGVTVVKFTDTSILDAAVIHQIARELYRLTDEQNKQRLILDFSNVMFLSSQTLGVLITLNDKIKAIRGSLVLVGLRKELMKVFKITNLDDLFTFLPDDASALATFNVHVK